MLRCRSLSSRFGVSVRLDSDEHAWLFHGLCRLLSDSSLIHTWPSGLAEAETSMQMRPHRHALLMRDHLRRLLRNSGKKAGLKHLVPCFCDPWRFLGLLVRSALARPSGGWSRRAAAGCRRQRAAPLLPRPSCFRCRNTQLSSSSEGSFAQLLGPVRELKAYLVCHELCRHGPQES